MKKDTEKKSEEREKLNPELEKAIAEKDEYLAGWKRARADFLNYQKEETERIIQRLNYAKEDWLLKIIAILDNMDIAESNMPEDLKNNEWVKGLLRTKNQISDFLRTEGVEEIKTAGEKFDLNFHEAVEEIGETEETGETGERKSGIIIEEIKKGYIFNNKVIRPARVKISK